MYVSEKKAFKKNAYEDCLEFLSVDAEMQGLKQIAITLEEARRKIHSMDVEEIANDNKKHFWKA